MADIFLSYARRDAAAARLIKDRLEALGLTVFFDTEGLDGGDVFPDVLDREVKTAGAIVGVWSTHALSRPWVKIECDIGRTRGVLVPVQIEPIADLDKPAAFWNLQVDDLSGFHGDTGHEGWGRFMRSLSRTLGRPDLMRQAAAPEATTQARETPARVAPQQPAKQRQRAARQSMSSGTGDAPVRMNRYLALILVAIMANLMITLAWSFVAAAVFEMAAGGGWDMGTIAPAMMGAGALNGLVFSVLGATAGHWLHGRAGMAWASALAIGGVAALMSAVYMFIGFGANTGGLLVGDALAAFAAGLVQIAVVTALAGWIATIITRRGPS